MTSPRLTNDWQALYKLSHTVMDIMASNFCLEAIVPCLLRHNGKLLETRFYRKQGKLRLFFGIVLEDTHRSFCVLMCVSCGHQHRRPYPCNLMPHIRSRKKILAHQNLTAKHPFVTNFCSLHYFSVIQCSL